MRVQALADPAASLSVLDLFPKLAKPAQHAHREERHRPHNEGGKEPVGKPVLGAQRDVDGDEQQEDRPAQGALCEHIREGSRLHDRPDFVAQDLLGVHVGGFLAPPRRPFDQPFGELSGDALFHQNLHDARPVEPPQEPTGDLPAKGTDAPPAQFDRLFPHRAGDVGIRQTHITYYGVSTAARSMRSGASMPKSRNTPCKPVLVASHSAKRAAVSWGWSSWITRQAS